MTRKVEKKLSCCILLVDDEANVRTVFSDVLKRAGYRVKAVENGHKAIKEVEKKTYNLALVDLRMPKMDGIEVLENIKIEKAKDSCHYLYRVWIGNHGGGSYEKRRLRLSQQALLSRGAKASHQKGLRTKRQYPTTLIR